MSVANKVLIYRWYEEVWNKQNERVLDEMLSAEVVLYGLADSPTEFLKGPEQFKKYWRAMLSVFPDVRIAVESTIAEDEKVVARCSLRATHQGDGLGFPATQQKVHITGVTIAVFKEGKVVEAWNNFDYLTVYRQLGAFPRQVQS